MNIGNGAASLRAAFTFVISFMFLLGECCGAANLKPEIPAVFDEKTVLALIHDIQEPGNATVLRVGYFGRRVKQAFPVEAGLASAEDAATHETIGSRRWFLLQSVCGFAGYRVSRQTRDEGGAAYDAIFTHTAQAEMSRSVDVAELAIQEYLVILVSNYGVADQLGLQDSKTQLLDALKQYMTFVQHGDSLTREIGWKAPVKAAYAYYEASAMVQDLLASQKVAKSFLLYKVASDIADAKDPAKAAILRAAALGRIEDASPEQEKAFCSDYVDGLAEQQRYLDAIAMQKQVVKKFGTGRPRLLLLFWQSKDMGSFADALDQARSTGCPEIDVQGAALVLEYLGDNGYANARSDEEKLLESYMATGRSRNPDYELWARYRLGTLYIQNANVSAARSILQLPGDLPERASQHGGRYVALIQKLVATLP